MSQQHLEAKISSDADNKRPAVKPAKPVRGQLVSNNKTRIAIALLIQNPALAKTHKVPPGFEHAFTKGLPLLYTLQQTIDSNTEISSTALLERFRDTEHAVALNKLAYLQTPETENTDNIADVYSDIIKRLFSEDRDEYLNHKINSNEPLTAEELEEYLKNPTK